mmetsp:Transcript_5553/g.23042  ORF Transcript_5553/g.23042 Transcript_5553/m.23042 type:complete len:562 (-) Transcript_5553:746-2431(-)
MPRVVARGVVVELVPLARFDRSEERSLEEGAVADLGVRAAVGVARRRQKVARVELGLRARAKGRRAGLDDDARPRRRGVVSVVVGDSADRAADGRLRRELELDAAREQRVEVGPRVGRDEDAPRAQRLVGIVVWSRRVVGNRDVVRAVVAARHAASDGIEMADAVPCAERELRPQELARRDVARGAALVETGVLDDTRFRSSSTPCVPQVVVVVVVVRRRARRSTCCLHRRIACGSIGRQDAGGRRRAGPGLEDANEVAAALDEVGRRDAAVQLVVDEGDEEVPPREEQRAAHEAQLAQRTPISGEHRVLRGVLVVVVVVSARVAGVLRLDGDLLLGARGCFVVGASLLLLLLLPGLVCAHRRVRLPGRALLGLFSALLLEVFSRVVPRRTRRRRTRRRRRLAGRLAAATGGCARGRLGLVVSRRALQVDVRARARGAQSREPREEPLHRRVVALERGESFEEHDLREPGVPFRPAAHGQDDVAIGEPTGAAGRPQRVRLAVDRGGQRHDLGRREAPLYERGGLAEPGVGTQAGTPSTARVVVDCICLRENAARRLFRTRG